MKRNGRKSFFLYSHILSNIGEDEVPFCQQKGFLQIINIKGTNNCAMHNLM